MHKINQNDGSPSKKKKKISLPLGRKKKEIPKRLCKTPWEKDATESQFQKKNKNLMQKKNGMQINPLGVVGA